MAITYNINLKKLEQNYKAFCKFGEVYFPVKTNHNQIILNKLKSLNSGFECDCVSHIKKIYTQKNADKIIYSNVAKENKDIIWAINHGIIFYTVDDKSTLNFIIKQAKKYKLNKLKINVRINVYEIFKQEFDEKNVIDSRLGASVETCRELLKIINSEKEIKLEKGISFYVQAEFHNNEDILIKVSDLIYKHFLKEDKMNWLNIGGGSTPLRINSSRKIMFTNLKKLNINKIILEPGRYMVGDIEDLYLPVKRIIFSNLNGGEYIASLAAGIYHGLLDYKLHKRQFDFNILHNNDLIKLNTFCGRGQKLVLRGPTADSSDILGIYEMPNVKITKNTIFVIKNIGAYVEVLNSNFSGQVQHKYTIIQN